MGLHRHEMDRLEASAALIAAQIHASELLAWQPSEREDRPAPVQEAMPGSQRFARPQEPSGSERPMRYISPIALPPDGPTIKQQLKHVEHQLSDQRRREFAEDLRIRLAEPIRPRPKFGCYEVNDLTKDTCRYPRGAKRIRFCGRQRMRGAYCGAHARVCYGSQK